MKTPNLYKTGLVLIIQTWIWGSSLKLFNPANHIHMIICVLQSIGNLKQLMFLDLSKNRVETLPTEIEGCVALADLHLSINMLQHLPESLGERNIMVLKALKHSFSEIIWCSNLQNHCVNEIMGYSRMIWSVKYVVKSLLQSSNKYFLASFRIYKIVNYWYSGYKDTEGSVFIFACVVI